MYGLVNKAVQDLIVCKFGQPVWEEIKRKAGVDITAFVRMTSYPDDITYRLVGAASEHLNLPAATVLEVFGEYWMTFTAQEGYGQMLKMVGKTFVEFLENLDNLHSRLQLSFPELKPPSVRCTDVTAESLRLHYYSERAGLAPFVVGLLKGLAATFNIRIDVRLDRPRGDAHDHDEFVVHMHPATAA